MWPNEWFYVKCLLNLTDLNELHLEWTRIIFSNIRAKACESELYVCLYASLCFTSPCAPLFQSGGPSITIRLKQRARLTLRNNLIPLKTPLSTTLFFTFSIVCFLHFTFLFSALPSLSAGFRKQTSADENLPSMSAVIPHTHTHAVLCYTHTVAHKRTQSCCHCIVLTQPSVYVCMCVCKLSICKKNWMLAPLELFPFRTWRIFFLP